MKSVELASYFESNVQLTMECRELIKAVRISFKYQEKFGNENIKVTYEFESPDDKADLLLPKIKALSKHMVFKPEFIWTLSTASNRNYGDSFVRLIEFRSAYTSVTAYVITRLEQILGRDFPIIVQDAESWPFTNYTRRSVERILDENRREVYNDVTKSDQHCQLLALDRRSQESKRLAFRLSDETITQHTGWEARKVRRVIIKYKIPVRTEGDKTIERVWFQPIDFLDALKQEVRRLQEERWEWSYRDLGKCKFLMMILYNEYLKKEKRKLIQQQQKEYVKHFPLQPYDIVYLGSDRFVAVKSIFLSDSSIVMLHYAVLKKNLDIGQRTATVEVDKVAFYLTANDFQEYLSRGFIKRISAPFKTWFKRHRKKLEYAVFEVDFFEGI